MNNNENAERVVEILDQMENDGELYRRCAVFMLDDVKESPHG